MSTERHDLTYTSHGTDCDAWFFPGVDISGFDGPGGRPVVVMAHGFAGTKDSGLEPYARRFADAGLAVLAFDYRGFGLSDGEPRQRISMAGQADDYRAAIDAATAQRGVDASRVILWGISQSGGHSLIVGADRTDIAAIIAMVPLVNGLSAGVHHYPQVGGAAMARSTAVGIGSAIAVRLGRPPTTMPVVGRPGDKAALTSPGFYDAYLSIAGPSWRNEVDATVGLELGSFRADKAAERIDAPVLMQIADFDQGAPPHAAAKAGFKARAEVRHYPCDHFDVFDGRDWFEPAVAHQLSFLRRHLAVERTADSEAAGAR
ncbi:alpha/beta fold hydrolase [Gordonia sp. ABSL11-1]|uniref:alpha/beta hydrolase n=1 Tax=Gordonia sp. ABSL11-1 TaxID=3053924 RepID=UPI0025738AFE|nr:alpha/beta fold hydrolase [Gordonia sp. ABSL11-1]MDL9948541.1 alpha/beta fold hydrolase [Gordonia sp. ABSL11-1]